MFLFRTTTRRFATSTRISSRECDQFGALSESGSQQLKTLALEQDVPEDPDGYDQIEMTVGNRKNAYYYKQNISLYARQGKSGLKKALELFRQMKAVDRLTPEQGNFSVLIYGCAKVGYTQKAFELYEEHLKYLRPGKKPSGAMVACLFNACSECPFPEYGLERLEWLRNQLSNQFSYMYNRTHYHAQIKAYGKLGQFQKAVNIVQEMIQAQLVPDTMTFNMLLIGCASDNTTGLANAIRLFRRIKQYNLEPDLDTYKLLLRCVRYCKIGPVENIHHILGELPALSDPNKRKNARFKKSKKNDKSSENPIMQSWIPLDDLPHITTRMDNTEKTPNLEDNDTLQSQLIRLDSERLDTQMSPNLIRDSVSELLVRVESLNSDSLNTNYGRLLLVGDVKGILDMMKSDRITPDAKTFGLLLTCLPRYWSKDQEILEYMKQYPIEFDTRIYDMMIERQGSKIFDKNKLDRAMQIVEMMQQRGVQPSISTYESLALCCGTLKDAQKLMSDLGDITPTYTLIKNLFINARYSNNIYYCIDLIKKCQQLGIRPDKALVEKLETKRLEVREQILMYEREVVEKKPAFFTPSFVQGFDIYSSTMKSYLKEFPIQDEIHPWSQYKVDNSYGRKGFSEFGDEMNKLRKDYWNSKTMEGNN